MNFALQGRSESNPLYLYWTCRGSGGYIIASLGNYYATGVYTCSIFTDSRDVPVITIKAKWCSMTMMGQGSKGGEAI